ncbi:MAG: YjbH domain-containing protein [Armatimonadota bacterium]|nr:YjbH domain-containing protein [Armatimonadota bacterium]
MCIRSLVCKLAAAAVLAVACGNCWSNPMLLAPTGTTLSTAQFRAEAALSPHNERGNYLWLAAGFKQFEASLIRMSNVAGEDANVFGVQWCFLPETFVTPAISLGVYDIGAQTDEGLGVYLAASKHISTKVAAPFLQDFSVTLGIGVGGIKGPFAAFEAKLPAGLFVQGEHDSRDLNGAVGWQPFPGFRLKAYSIRKDTYYGAEFISPLF